MSLNDRLWCQKHIFSSYRFKSKIWFPKLSKAVTIQNVLIFWYTKKTTPIQTIILQNSIIKYSLRETAFECGSHLVLRLKRFWINLWLNFTIAMMLCVSKTRITSLHKKQNILWETITTNVNKVLKTKC